ncbi:MAG: PH domain-containing protein [Bacteroidota bacterium]
MESTQDLLFDNAPVDIRSLPSTEQLTFNRLADGYLWVMFLRSNLFFLIISLIAVIITLAKGELELTDWLYAAGGWFVLWVLFNVLIPLKFRQKGYALRDKDMVYKSGLLWKKIIIIPLNRIQHCEVQQGPFSKIFGLKSLTAFTAGGASSDLRVAGLPEEKAEQLKEFIISKITNEHDTTS